eukprot:2023563-Pyramimonas_sp.AAC.2
MSELSALGASTNRVVARDFSSRLITWICAGVPWICAGVPWIRAGVPWIRAGGGGRKEGGEVVKEVRLALRAVVCINKSHYVTYARAKNPLSAADTWLYSDSMADTQ